jgi:hypothetical protein
MKTEVRDDWADWLEANAAAQTSGALVKIDSFTGKRSYCCLGGLCEVAVAAGVIERSEYGDFENSWDEELPREVADWAGLGSTNPLLTRGTQSESATMWNDEIQASFYEISEMVRALSGEIETLLT